MSRRRSLGDGRSQPGGLVEHVTLPASSSSVLFSGGCCTDWLPTSRHSWTCHSLLLRCTLRPHGPLRQPLRAASAEALKPTVAAIEVNLRAWQHANTAACT